MYAGIIKVLTVTNHNKRKMANARFKEVIIISYIVRVSLVCVCVCVCVQESLCSHTSTKVTNATPSMSVG